MTGLHHTWTIVNSFCRINCSPSDVKGISFRVPQYSCLCPLLFVIYVNDLPFSLQNSRVSMYANDTTISLSSKIKALVTCKMT